MNKKYILNLGLAFTLLYAGIGALVHPIDWVSFVPAWVNRFGLNEMTALHIHSIGEILLGILLLAKWKIKWVSLLTALDIAAIIIVNGFSHTVLLATFRDVGLLTMAIYLAVAD